MGIYCPVVLLPMYDVAVVGGGPGGSVAALVAAKLGLKVLLLDRFRFPRVKPCGGGLTPKSLVLLGALGIDASGIVRSRCDEVLVVNYSGNYWLRGRVPLITVTSRDEFDNYLLNLAMDHGVEYIVDKVRGVVNAQGHVEIVGDSGTYEASYVIGADGAGSLVARSLGINPMGTQRAIAYMTIAKGSLPSNICILDLTAVRWGYAWSFPRGDLEHDVGLGTLEWGDYTSRLRSYVEGLGLSMGRVLGHPIPIEPRGPGHGRVLLVGDAGGFADPVTGEGIFHAMYTGVLAALAVVKSRGGDPIINYSRLVRPLVRNLELARKFAYGFYGLDTLVMSRWGLSMMGYISDVVNRVISGSSWYRDVLKSSLRFTLRRAPLIIFKELLLH